MAIPLVPDIVDRLHGSGRLDFKREALVACALRFNLVSERHLTLLA